MIHPKSKPYIVIMAGGGGTRLWPKSRQSVPKQFLKLFSNKTLLQETYTRVAPLTDNDKIYIVALETYKEEILAELPDLDEKNVIIEPDRKNTAAALGLTCMHILKKDPDAVVHFLPADHYIVDVGEFQRILITSSLYAEEHDDIIVWGILPNRAATEYGYIHSGDDIEEINNVTLFKVKGFREKPNEITAQAFVASGKYFWNGGQYSQKAKVLVNAIKQHMPALHKGLEEIAAAIDTSHYAEVLKERYAEFESVAIDVGVTEKVRNLVMIPASYGWSDIGSWDALYDISPKNEGSNAVLVDGGYLGIDTEGCLIQGADRMIATIGLNDLVIIDTKDVLMISQKSRSQDVKKLVEQLKEKEKKEYL